MPPQNATMELRFACFTRAVVFIGTVFKGATVAGGSGTSKDLLEARNWSLEDFRRWALLAELG